MPTLNTILKEYGLNPEQFIIKAYGTGLINHTWRLTNSKEDYILQRINSKVFVQPCDIAFNIDTIAQYLNQRHPEYLFTVPVTSLNNTGLVYDKEEGYFRLYHFIRGSHTIDVVLNPQQAYEAARQFGMFTKLLACLPPATLRITIPDFHNLSLRYGQFEEALKSGNKSRIIESKSAILFIQQNKHIPDAYDKIKVDPNFKLRVTHHDTKISNVLFNENDEGLCVIDLDTVMPGFFISDVGDMMRTYLSPASEEEKEPDKITVREDFFQAILEGYLSEMKNELSREEIAHFVYAGKFMIYMQAIRFLTDYINDDVYYGARYTDHNLVRALNQITLLKRLTEKEQCFDEIVAAYSKTF